MKIAARLLLMLGVLGATFLGAIWLLHRSQASEAADILESLRRERGALLENLISLQGSNLETFATDYANWDEMVAFLNSRDPQWAATNLTASLERFETNYVWVLDTNGQSVFATAPEIPPEPESGEPLLAALRARRTLHFFAPSAEGPIEIRAAPITPSEDTTRQAEPRGWLLIGRVWTQARVQSLARLIDSSIRLVPAPSPSAAPKGELQFLRPLPDLGGQPAAILFVSYRPPSLQFLLESNTEENALLILCGLAVILVVGAGVGGWIVIPIRRLEAALATQDAAPLAPLLQRHDEFARLGQLTKEAFAHQSRLEREINERRRTEIMLNKREQQLRRAVDSRARLARDLHDGIIQAIYATGLGLEHTRQTIETDPAGAQKKLSSLQQGLNHAIRELRSFILDLEPEAIDGHNLSRALSALVESLREIHPVEIESRLPTASRSPFTPMEENNILQISREALSNALRHSGASRVQLRLDYDAERPELEISDNGRGFDPDHFFQGKGLSNLRARASALGAEISLLASPGSGTQILLRFPPRSPPL